VCPFYLQSAGCHAPLKGRHTIRRWRKRCRGTGHRPPSLKRPEKRRPETPGFSVIPRQMSGVIAEFEREIIGERGLAGQGCARASGVWFGRPTASADKAASIVADLKGVGRRQAGEAFTASVLGLFRSSRRSWSVGDVPRQFPMAFPVNFRPSRVLRD
jgi:hypothetical protein